MCVINPEANLTRELIEVFNQLEINIEKMIGEMVEAGAEVARSNIKAKMPKELYKAIETSGEADVNITRIYKTPSDDGINCQAYIGGYFINRNNKKTPAPLVANMFEYGSETRNYPKKRFLKASFNKSQIEKAMLDVQEKYITGGK